MADETTARQFVSELTDEQGMERLERLRDFLFEENSRQNLISRPSEAHIWQRHIGDSAQLLNFVPRETLEDGSHTWLDLGTGAGFPGLVISALLPQIPVILVESRRRRVEWLEMAALELKLSNCKVIGERLEAVSPFRASVISARAFAPLPKLLSLSAPFSTRATTYVLPKGRSAAQELQDLPLRQRKLFHVEQSLTDVDAGIIVGQLESPT